MKEKYMGRPELGINEILRIISHFRSKRSQVCLFNVRRNLDWPSSDWEVE